MVWAWMEVSIDLFGGYSIHASQMSMPSRGRWECECTPLPQIAVAIASSWLSLLSAELFSKLRLFSAASVNPNCSCFPLCFVTVVVVVLPSLGLVVVFSIKGLCAPVAFLRRNTEDSVLFEWRSGLKGMPSHWNCVSVSVVRDLVFVTVLFQHCRPCCFEVCWFEMVLLGPHLFIRMLTTCYTGPTWKNLPTNWRPDMCRRRAQVNQFGDWRPISQNKNRHLFDWRKLKKKIQRMENVAVFNQNEFT